MFTSKRSYEQCLFQSTVYIKRKLGLWRAQKCIPLVSTKRALTCAGPQNTPSHVRQYRVENGNLGKFGPTFRLGAVFPPQQCVHQKEDTAMESLEIYSSSRCKKRTYRCGSANHPVSCMAVQGRERKFGEIPAYL